MNKCFLLLVVCFLVTALGLAQDKDIQEQQPDSVQQTLKEQGVRVIDTLKIKKKGINPLAPSKAAFYSAVFPGLGQIYNKRYWKVPIVYAAIGTGVYAYTYNDDLYNRFRTAFKRRQAGFTDDEFYDLGTPNPPGSPPDFSNQALENAQERYQRDRDLWLLVTIGMYVLNIVDANVDAHLKQFNVDDDLSLDFKPFLDTDALTANPVYGMALTIKF
ncbi:MULTISPECIES: DUF5683 domain-containing protein [Arenibacter]|uniref:DUF5683 domain-containing protein n=1 Tax=Arenibacter TaxID=178469 RepID=UPI001CC5A5A3|nr:MULTISPECIES: DUF5683 domain-containing protein [Arenibacter]